MDLDAYTDAHRGEWARLDALAKQRRLDGRQADELIEGYRAGATQLSAIKTSAGSTAIGDRLSVTLSRARLRFTGATDNLLGALPAFFGAQLPAAFYRVRWLTVVVMLVTVAIGAIYATWIAGDPRVLASYGDDADLRRYVDSEFTDYYSSNPAASFAGQVWTNNAYIAAQCVAFGITGIWVPYVIFSNAQSVGIAAGVMFSYDRGDVFFEYILPHGMLELTAVFVAAAAGLRIFWALIAPGPRTRAQALAEDGRALFTVAIGLVLVLFVSGIIEGFVTPAPWPWWIKMTIGGGALAAYWFYTLYFGRRAYRAGQTGDLDEFEAGARRITSG
ncbi:stage II sporulation protein M [Herbiconiux sp. L3-i23]|uniref:stage II sporulation protein M n=1 Tax=Herbiconiux sp. L3-i23 TaxID=2905871 RepID=UPI0020741026|nr:stage II sporulation protein M [Herbiconiux sp. L3-i23]